MKQQIDSHNKKLELLFTAIKIITLKTRDMLLEQDFETSDINAYEDSQTNLDKKIDAMIVNELLSSGVVSEIFSEEREEIIVSENVRDGFCITLDPLDGSKGIATNTTCGSIFGIYNKPFTEKGSEMIAAAYSVFGPKVLLVIATKDHLIELTLNQDHEFVYHYNHRMKQGTILRTGGLRKSYNNRDLGFVQLLEREGFKLNYSDALVANIHHLIHNGGFYIYPSTIEYPQGKTRLLIEAKPMAFIVNAAGGETNRIMDLPPDLFARVPFVAGEKRLVEMHKQLYSRK